jgi:two-component system sensor histidine kinase BaeS
MLLDETRVLSRLIEDLRTLAMAESGHLVLHKEPVQVAELLADLATSFRAQAEAAGITLTVDTDSLDDTTIEADLMRLNQILANLIVNALRYTPSGGTITLRGELGGSAAGGVSLSVTDTGQGIQASDLPHVFDRFWRGDPARTHKEGAGAGLGLAIVKQLVELHGGSISVSSEVGKGSTFKVRMPTV